MIQAVAYISTRFVLNIYYFLRHWYYNSFLNTSDFMLGVFHELDKFFALKISFRNLFKPLYQDRTIIGYTLGFLFRFFRIIIASIIYSIIFIISVALYIAWLAILVYIIYRIFA